MMEVYNSEEEQVEALRKWWEQNGRAVILGFVIGLSGIFGWQAWDRYEKGLAETASAEYSHLIDDLKAEKYEEVLAKAIAIRENYSRTPYADLSGLIAAKALVAQGNVDEAITHLQSVADNAGQEDLQFIAKLRLAQLHYAQANYEKAIALLLINYPESYKAKVNELKGDIYTAQGTTTAAAEAYDAALAVAELDAQHRQVIQVKRDQLGINKVDSST